MLKSILCFFKLIIGYVMTVVDIAMILYCTKYHRFVIIFLPTILFTNFWQYVSQQQAKSATQREGGRLRELLKKCRFSVPLLMS